MHPEPAASAASVPAKPAEVFDRDHEWDDLLRFLTRPVATQLGIVYGRRRQGKSFLLYAALGLRLRLPARRCRGAQRAR
jgi:hypothetical protein